MVKTIEQHRLEQRLAEVDRQLASGVQRIDYADRGGVVFRSVDDLLRQKALLERRLNRARIRRVVVIPDKGI